MRSWSGELTRFIPKQDSGWSSWRRRGSRFTSPRGPWLRLWARRLVWQRTLWPMLWKKHRFAPTRGILLSCKSKRQRFRSTATNPHYVPMAMLRVRLWIHRNLFQRYFRNLVPSVRRPCSFIKKTHPPPFFKKKQTIQLEINRTRRSDARCQFLDLRPDFLVCRLFLGNPMVSSILLPLL